MSKGGIQTSPRQQGKPAAVVLEAAPEVQVRRRHQNPAVQVLMAIASLRVTVVLFVLSMILVFCGTLAQTDVSIHTAVKDYFRSFFVWIPWQLFVKLGQVFLGVEPQAKVAGSFPFPGGWTIGGLLLINLLAAHAVRFRLTWNRAGILLTHSGVVLLMVGELLTGTMAVEARMTIAEGETTNFVEVFNSMELDFIDRSDKDNDRVIVIPGSKLQKPGSISHSLLPVDVTVVEYMKNTELFTLRRQSDEFKDVFVADDGTIYALAAQADAKGVGSEHDDVPSVRIELRAKGSGDVLGKHLASMWFNPNYSRRQFSFPPQQVKVDGKTYDIELRPERVYKDYSVTLKKFTHSKYTGTDTPRDFRSTVRLLDPAHGEDREVEISMNAPLRYAGEAFYQSAFLPDDSGTVLQVVRNPAWTLPYLSCIIVGLGMTVHFGMTLVGFLRKRMAEL